MPTTYKVIIDGKETGDSITANNYADAYFEIASTVPLTYQTEVVLVPVEQAIKTR